MGLETGTYIDDLVATNPDGADDAGTIDNHIRLIKLLLKNSFPNISGAVTPTHTELNYVDGVTSAIQTQLDSKFNTTDVAAGSGDIGGASSTDLLTPAGIGAAATLVANNGIWRLGGLTVQWGSDTLSAGTAQLKTIIFPVEFTSVFFLTAQIVSTSVADVVHNIASYDVNFLNIKYTTATSKTGYWFAIGTEA